MITAFVALIKSLSWQTYLCVALGVAGAAIYAEKTVRIDLLVHQNAGLTAKVNGLQGSITAAQKLATETAAADAADIKDIANESQRFAAQARTDAAVPSHDRLLQRALASAGQAASAPQGSSTASGAGLLLTDVLRKSDERSGQLAAYADQARIAGQACEQSYAVIESERGDDDK